MAVEHGSVPENEVLLRHRSGNSADDSLLSFEVVNHGDFPIVCPDSWYLEFKDGSTTNLSLAPSGDVRVNAGSTGTVSIPKPVSTKPWRLGASYYEEDVVFDVKVRIDQSSLKSYLPASASSVRGKVALSDWVN